MSESIYSVKCALFKLAAVMYVLGQATYFTEVLVC